MKLLVPEDGSEDVTSATKRASALAASRILYVEARSFIARRRLEGRLHDRDVATARSSLDALWRAAAIVELDVAVTEAAAALADRHALRGMDAIHLASALKVHNEEPDLIFATWAADLRRAAVREGIRTLSA